MNWNHIDSSNIVFSEGGVRDTTDRHPLRSNLSVWVFTIVEKGQRTLLLNDEEIRIGENEFFVLPPNTVHAPLELDNHKAYYIHFKADGAEILTPDHIDASKIILPIQEKLPLRFDIFSYIKAVIENSMSPYPDQDFCSLQIKAILYMLSLECQKKLHRPQSTEISDQILEFVQKTLLNLYVLRITNAIFAGATIISMRFSKASLAVRLSNIISKYEWNKLHVCWYLANLYRKQLLIADLMIISIF